ncbi:hypothetical protein EJ08DRAFT_651757 [Tothia fuscella]|uniref:Vacuolar ATPase assembly integral membrane protein VMA21 n=1 Tax=Tothia fuscella TaxID=1048955 RepID=A0A9P4NLG4_9PEZI|nr:hypothetical protein EJ08DRAFT_651757 [Tothia fuscella]
MPTRSRHLNLTETPPERYHEVCDTIHKSSSTHPSYKLSQSTLIISRAKQIYWRFYHILAPGQSVPQSISNATATTNLNTHTNSKPKALGLIIMATRRTNAKAVEQIQVDNTHEKGPSDIRPAVPAYVIYKLLGFTFAMIILPIGSYFLTVNTIFSGKGKSSYAGALAAIVANVVLIGYVVVAMREDEEERLEHNIADVVKKVEKKVE